MQEEVKEQYSENNKIISKISYHLTRQLYEPYVRQIHQ